jgi:hypothetical protein
MRIYMRKYCKAFQLEDLRRFTGWHEQSRKHGGAPPTPTICYLWDDFTVATSPVLKDSLLFDTVTPEWQAFCTTTLGFVVLEELSYAYE